MNITCLPFRFLFHKLSPMKATIFLICGRDRMHDSTTTFGTIWSHSQMPWTSTPYLSNEFTTWTAFEGWGHGSSTVNLPMLRAQSQKKIIKFHIHHDEVNSIAEGTFTLSRSHVWGGPITVIAVKGTFSLDAHQDMCRLILKSEDFDNWFSEIVAEVQSTLLKKPLHLWHTYSIILHYWRYAPLFLEVQQDMCKSFARNVPIFLPPWSSKSTIEFCLLGTSFTL